MTELRIDLKPVVYVLLWVVMVLSFLNASLLGLHFYPGDSAPDTLAASFDFEIEGNILTLNSAVAMLICSGLTASDELTTVKMQSAAPACVQLENAHYHGRMLCIRLRCGGGLL